MATLAIQTIDNDGLIPAYVSAAGGGDKVVCGAGAFVHYKNGSGGSITVTLETPQTVDGNLAVGDRAVAIGAGAEAFIAVPNLYKDPTDGLAHLTYSGVTSLTVASLRAPVAG